MRSPFFGLLALADTSAALTAALLVRPLWRPPVANPAAEYDPRILVAPLQELVFLNAPFTLWHELKQASSGWLVFTSPASVQAFAHWIQQAHLLGACPPGLQIAAVGSGTRQSLAALESIGFLSADRAAAAISSAEAHRADANTLLHAMQQAVSDQRLDWNAQTVMVVEGKGNRPQIKASLRSLGARVLGLALYERVDLAWPTAVLDRLRAAQPGSVAIVLTSSHVIESAFHQLSSAAIDSSRVVWCTHHQTIAAALAQMQSGLQGRIRSVRLDPQALQEDLFAHEKYW